MKKNAGQLYLAIAASLLGGLTLLPLARAGDAGELFPNVAPYDETVSSPISKPVQTPPKPQPAPATPPTAPVKTPPPDSKIPEPGPAVDPNKPRHNHPPKDPPEVTPPETTTEPAPAAPRPLIQLTPYSTGLLTPILTAQEQDAFNTQYADTLAKALAGNADTRKKTAEAFDAAAQNAPSPALKRYLLLQAFGMYVRAATPLLERVQKVESLLPLLTEETLPVLQARADALNDLMLSSSSNPNERFLDLYIDAHLTLAKLQVQAGFPRDAQVSLKKARDASLHDLHKSQTRIDQINETAAWCDRSSAAALLWPKFQETLKAAPDDLFTNDMMATFHLSLYGNLASAAPFAARSDRKDLKNLAEVLKANPPQALSADPDKHAEQILAIAAALVDVAKATSAAQPFDRYSIACYAGDHIDEMLSESQISADKIPQAQALLAAAREIVDKTNLRRGNDLPRWLAGPASSSGKNAPARSVANLADLFRGLPPDLTPTQSGWDDKQCAAVTDWLNKNVVGFVYEGEALKDKIGDPGQSDGKMYVPVLFGLTKTAFTENLSISTTIELRMSVKLAERTKSIKRETATTIKGSIVSAQVHPDGPNSARLDLVLNYKAD